MTRPLDSQDVAGLFDRCPDRGNIGRTVSAHGELTCVEVNGDLENAGHQGNFGLHCVHTMAARHAGDGEDTGLHSGIVASADRDRHRARTGGDR